VTPHLRLVRPDDPVELDPAPPPRWSYSVTPPPTPGRLPELALLAGAMIGAAVGSALVALLVGM
jgi:hypothetical protein